MDWDQHHRFHRLTGGVRRARKRERSGRCRASAGRVREWRRRPRAWFPPPATSTRTCGSPADGLPTTVGRRHSRTPPASPGQIAGRDSTRSTPRVGLTDAGPRQPCPPPWPQTPPHGAIQGRQLPGGGAHAAGGAPPAEKRIEGGGHRRQCPTQAPPPRLPPTLPAHGCQGVLAGPHQGHHAPALPRLDRLNVAAQTRKALVRPLHEARLRGRARARALRHNPCDRLKRARGGCPRTTAEHTIVRPPRQAPQCPVARRPVPRAHVHVEVGHQGAADAPLRAPPRGRLPSTVLPHSPVQPWAPSLPPPPVAAPPWDQAPHHVVGEGGNGGLEGGVDHLPAAPPRRCDPLDRVGRPPSDWSWPLASTRGASTSVPAGWTTRARPVGTPSGRGRPAGVGRSPRRTGGGLARPPDGRPPRHGTRPLRGHGPRGPRFSHGRARPARPAPAHRAGRGGRRAHGTDGFRRL
jgi:hypothetical protein